MDEKNKKKEINIKKKDVVKVKKKNISKKIPDELKKEDREYLEQVLTEKQLNEYDNASEQQQVWLLVLCKYGDYRKAEKIAYPNVKQSARYQLSHKNRLKFDICMADILRSVGIDEVMIGKKINTLLQAKRIKRTYVKGDLSEEVEEEDNFAISKGIDHAVKHLKIDPGEKVVHDVDSIMSVINAAANANKKN